MRYTILIGYSRYAVAVAAAVVEVEVAEVEVELAPDWLKLTGTILNEIQLSDWSRAVTCAIYSILIGCGPYQRTLLCRNPPLPESPF